MSPEATRTREWVEDFVVRLNLCPFAGAPLRTGTLSFATCQHDTAEQIFYWSGTQVQRFLEAEPSRERTTLLVLPQGPSDFEDFLDLVEDLEELLVQAGASELVQLAHFHPHYVFGDGQGPDDPANATNRSPYPTVQLLRVADVAGAVGAYGDTGQIPVRNATLLRGLAHEGAADDAGIGDQD